MGGRWLSQRRELQIAREDWRTDYSLVVVWFQVVIAVSLREYGPPKRRAVGGYAQGVAVTGSNPPPHLVQMSSPPTGLLSSHSFSSLVRRALGLHWASNPFSV